MPIGGGRAALVKPSSAAIEAVTFSRTRSGTSGMINGTTPQANLLGTPTAGRLLIATACHREALATDPSISDGVSGTWNMRVAHAVGLGNTHDRRKLWVFSKIADGTEDAILVCTFASSVACMFSVHEFSANSSFAWDFIGAGTADTGTGASTSEPTYANYGGTSDPTIETSGVAATPTGGKSLFRLSVMGARAGESGDFGSSWTFAGTNVQHQPSGGYQVAQALAFANDEAGGASLTDTLDWDSLYLQPSIAHLVFGHS